MAAGQAVAAVLVGEAPVETGNKVVKSEIPFWLKSYLQPEDFSKIETAIVEAEEKTSGEIIPMVVQSSTAVKHVTPLITLFFICLLLMFENHFQWWTPFALLGCYVSAYFLGKLHAVQRFLTHDQDEQIQVLRRAQVEFLNSKFYKTKDRTGILIFLSVMERKAVVLADEAISSKLPAETWQQVLDLLLQQMKKKNMADGFVQAIGKCGELLSEHFPLKTGDQNEIKNHLVISKH